MGWCYTPARVFTSQLKTGAVAVRGLLFYCYCRSSELLFLPYPFHILFIFSVLAYSKFFFYQVLLLFMQWFCNATCTYIGLTTMSVSSVLRSKHSSF